MWNKPHKYPSKARCKFEKMCGEEKGLARLINLFCSDKQVSNRPNNADDLNLTKIGNNFTQSQKSLFFLFYFVTLYVFRVVLLTLLFPADFTTYFKSKFLIYKINTIFFFMFLP